MQSICLLAIFITIAHRFDGKRSVRQYWLVAVAVACFTVLVAVLLFSTRCACFCFLHRFIYLLLVAFFFFFFFYFATKLASHPFRVKLWHILAN